MECEPVLAKILEMPPLLVTPPATRDREKCRNDTADKHHRRREKKRERKRGRMGG